MGLGRQLLTGVVDLLFPRPSRCPVCQGELALDGEVPCPGCRSKVELVSPPFCEKCGKPLAVAGECPDCRGRNWPFVRARAAGVYDGVLRECLHRLKYRGDTSLLPYLQGLLLGCLASFSLPAVDLVVPVPLHREREWERGFNQAALLAAAVARQLRKPLVPRALVRTRPTPPTSELSRSLREEALKGAFAPWDRCLTGRTVLLVDDIYTTGTTASECSRALLAGGAREVYVLTVATVPKLRR